MYHPKEMIVILDYGSQTTQLIARRVRELGVYSEVLPATISTEKIKQLKPKGIILSGGPNSVTDESKIALNAVVFELNIPVLGICYGMQVMTQFFGGEVTAQNSSEYGLAKVKYNPNEAILKHINTDDHVMKVWMSHGDSVTQIPEGFEIIGSSHDCNAVMIANNDKQYFGLQFHPELTHTDYGKQILSNFVHDACQCGNDWTPAHIVDTAIADIKKQVADERVLLALSGGVDSSVLAALLHKAIGKQLIAVFVDNGLLRLNEVQQVTKLFKELLGDNFMIVDAKQQFYDALKDIDEPEAKRKIIGNTFIDIFDKTAQSLGDIKYLAQGTIYPDVIESAKHEGSAAEVIKSHHNVGGLPEDMMFELVEPLRMCFKDEVRLIGEQLGLSKAIICRHPFPGPGLAVRILGEIKLEYIKILQQVDAIFLEILREADLYDKVSQAFAVFLPIKSVGVKGDARAYGYVVALRSVNTTDFMSAHVSQIPLAILEKAALRIMNEVKEITRVVYDISSKPPSTIEWE